MKCPLVVLALLGWAGTTPAADHDAAVRSLVQTELAYARMAATSGVRDAYLANTTADSVLLGPTGPVLGQKFYGEMPPLTPAQMLIEWYPTVAEVSADEDMGVTAGAYRAHAAARSGSIEWAGNYLSVWRKQGDGAWKVVLDGGVQHDGAMTLPRFGEPGAPRLGSPSGRPRSKRSLSARDQAQLDKGLLDADEGFVARFRASGVKQALRDAASSDLVVIRDGIGMVARLDAVLSMSEKLPQMACGQRMEARVSRSGDLGYTYGSCESKAADGETLYYIRVWRRDPGAEWRVLLDIVNVPPPALKQMGS